jgi:uncharacterized protein (TIGR02679 family)
VVTRHPSLATPGLAAVWAGVRDRLERAGADNRGRLRLPALTADARLALEAVTGRRTTATVDLAALEQGLRSLGLGDDLPAALAALGHPVSDLPGRRRAERTVARQAREAARAEASTWNEPWAIAWIDEVIRTGGLRGCDPDGAKVLVRSVRRLIDHLDGLMEPDGSAGGAGSVGAACTTGTAGMASTAGATGAIAATGAAVSRVDLAARLFGSAHALDAGTRLEAAATRALAHRLGAGQARDLWERAGAHLDLTSGPVLTWRLPVAPTSGLASLVGQATTLGLPLHLSRFALRAHPVTVTAGADVLVVENPRVVEAAAQFDSATPFVAANGNPSGAVRLLIAQLVSAGARLRYHGDFDAAGLAICARMHAVGLTPWRMDADDYLAALDAADTDGVDLPVDHTPAPPTPWHPALRDAFDRERRIVHEERLLASLIDT